MQEPTENPPENPERRLVPAEELIDGASLPSVKQTDPLMKEPWPRDEQGQPITGFGGG